MVTKIFPARWADHAVAEPGDAVFVVTRECLTPPDTRGRRHRVNNSVYYRWADSHGHGSCAALPGQFVTARTLWPDVAEPDRGAYVAEALACERLVEVGVVDSVTPDRIGVEYTLAGLRHLYSIAPDATPEEIVVALALYHGLDPRDTSTDYAPTRCLSAYIGILTAPEPEPVAAVPAPRARKASA